MKTFWPVLLSALFFSTHYAAAAEFYSWTDSAGNIVITDDPGRIPTTRPHHEMRTRRLPDQDNDELNQERSHEHAHAQHPSTTMSPQAQAPIQTPTRKPQTANTHQYIYIPVESNSAIDPSDSHEADKPTTREGQAASLYSRRSSPNTHSAAAGKDRPLAHPDGHITPPTPLPANLPSVTPHTIPDGSGAAAARR
jgi:hypothetical protein